MADPKTKKEQAGTKPMLVNYFYIFG